MTPDITHEALDAAGRPGTRMFRSFLVATRVLPERDERFHAFDEWIQRTAALGQLAQQLPPPILARLTGPIPSTAVRWNAAVSGSYARNLPSLHGSTK